MIEKIANDVSNKLMVSAPSSDFNDLVGMIAHMRKMERLLCLESDEVRMIGICGLSGIGKSTIAKVLFVEYSHMFQLSVFMENFKTKYPKPYLHSAQLQLQTEFLSQIINQKDIKIHHLGVVQDRLKDKRVLVVLDDVDHLMQLHAMAKNTWWFGPGSRIIITTQDKGVLIRHGIEHIYKVGFPDDDEALQIFCMSAFGQKFPEDGFEDFARKVTWLAGNLPLGLKIMGSHFRGLSKHRWEMELPRLWSSIDGEIESILKYSYDALCDEDKDLFVYIACFFNYELTERVEAFLAKKFSSVRTGLQVLAEKSIISVSKWAAMSTRIEMHNLLVRFGREIDRKQSNGDCGQLKFLVDAKETCQVLSDYTQTITNLKFMDLRNSSNLKELPDLSTATNLQKLILSNCSSLVKLPSSIGNVTNLKELDLSGCSSLVKLPSLIGNDTNLNKLNLGDAQDWLVKLPSSIGNATNLKKLNLGDAQVWWSSHLSIGNATNLKNLNLRGCSSLVEFPSSIGNLHKLQRLFLDSCSNLKTLPSNINMKYLEELSLTYCPLLKTFPEISTNIGRLMLNGTAIEEIPSSIRSWSRLRYFVVPYSVNLRKSLHAFDLITELHVCDNRIQELALWIKEMSRLEKLVIRESTKLVSLPHLPDSLRLLDAEDCESLESLDSSLYNVKLSYANFGNCFKLNQEARDLIMRTCREALLPGEKVPTCFHWRATGSSLSMKWNGTDTQKTIFKACVSLVNYGDVEFGDRKEVSVACNIKDKQNGTRVGQKLEISWESFPLLEEHLYVDTFEIEEEVSCRELVFEFKVYCEKKWEIRECGLGLVPKL